MGVPIINTLFVAGAGHMGHGIAQVAACAGLEVTLYDVSPVALAAAVEKVRWSLAKLHEKGRVAETPEAVLIRLTTATDPAAAASAQLVIEAVPERQELKQKVLAQLDAACPPGVIFASNTSAIPITLLASFTGRPDRFCGLHFFGPVQLMPLVEVTRGRQTGDATVEAIMGFVKRIGKEPVVVRRDVAGFVVNRVLMAATCEAARLVESGVASAADVDRAMRLGCNWKMGPLELSDFSGLDVVLGAIKAIHSEKDDPVFAPPALLERLVGEGKLGRKTGAGFYEYPSA